MSPSNRQPKYRIVEDYLRDQISSGGFAVGSILPTEEELRRQFGVSRATVRTALGKIQSDGLITKSPAIGSRVISRAPKQEFSAGWDSFDDLMQYAKDARFQLETSEKLITDSELSDLTGFDAGRNLIRVKGLRARLGEPDPTCILHIYFDALYGGILDYVNDSGKPIAALIEEHFRLRIMSIRQEISATLLNETDAALLAAPAGSAALVIRRWYSDTDGHVFEMSQAIYPADRLRYTMTLGRSPSASNGG
ncbi:GntR family transcriptional regulator [Microbulbifer sp. S227A]|uniref:GntR family transcriptional regulator n=1 Tax=Microbulbifer sp. S227A TaxID=3415131 RepID=UPI003C7CFEBD